MRDPQSLNKYAYVRNNPLKYTDPTGHFWHIAIGALAGALVATAFQAGSDLVHGHLSSASQYKAAAVGGAIQGAAMAANPTIAVAVVAGAVSSVAAIKTKDYLDGTKTAPSDMVGPTVLGAASSLIPGPKLAPGTATTISKQMNTKFVNGTISNITMKTADNMLIGDQMQLLPGATAEFLGNSALNYFNSKNASQSMCYFDNNSSTYTVQSGDTLSKIFGSNWKQIAEYNNLSDPNKIKVGQKLKVPGAE